MDDKPLPGTFALPTLDTYQAALRAKLGSDKNMSGWGQNLQRHVFDLTRGPMGYKSEDERKIAASSAIMQDAISKAAAVESDPLKQRQRVLTDVIQRFNALGMTDLVAQAMPELTNLNQQLTEMRKLSAEADTANMTADMAAETYGARKEEALLGPEAKRGAMRATDASAARDRMETRLSAAEGQNYQSPDGKTTINVGKLSEDRRNALRDAGWVEVQAVNRDAATLGGKKEAEEFRAFAGDTANLLNALGDIKELAIAQPGAWAVGGQALSAAQGLVNQVNYSMRQRGIDPGDFAAATATTRDGTSTAGLMKQARIADARQQAMVLNLAYVRAKALDPGGRLSNQDVEIAMKIVAGSDPVQQIALLEDIANTATRSFDTKASVLSIPQDDPVRGVVQSARDRYGAIAPAATTTGDPVVDKYLR